MFRKRPFMVNDFVYKRYPDEVDDSVIADLLARPEEYTNSDGYKVRLNGGAIHPKNKWIAYIDYYKKTQQLAGHFVDCKYYLRIVAEGKQIFEWEVKTYNPYFGAVTCYVKWHADTLIYVYLEKHSLYGVSANLSQILDRIELGLVGVEFTVLEDIIYILPISNYDGMLKRFQIPSWKELKPINERQALNLGIIEF